MGCARQSAQDANAVSASPSALVSRSISKGNDVYCNDAWDLVDAIKNGKCKLDDVKDEDLPESLRKLDKAKRKSKVEDAARERVAIQKQINELSQQREKFLAEERKKRHAAKDDSLEQAIVKVIREQACAVSPQLRVIPMDRKRILVIEDDAAIRRGLVDALSFAGYATSEAGDGTEGLAAARGSEFDLLVLDLVLPGRDGLTILRELRAERSALPVIILTARGAEADRVRGLDEGADDYVVKPFSLKELLARIEAVLRRAPPRPSAVPRLDFDGGVADLERHEIRYHDGRRVPLSEREQSLLGYLALHSGRAVSRDELLAKVWGLSPAGITTRTIDMHIARGWREKLRDDPDDPRIVITVRGQGYMLDGRRSP